MRPPRRTLPALAAGLLSLATAAYSAPPVTPAWVPRAVVYEVNFGVFSPTGDFKGVEARLPDLQRLGVTTVWLMPIHPVGVVKSFGSPYCVRDYFGINPALGTAQDLHRLVRAVHARHMKIILDIVANHTAWDNPLITSHPEYYKHDAQGNIISPNADWKDVAGLDYHSPGLRGYMTGVLKYWLRSFDVDGYRCDSAGLLPTDFWEAASTEARKVKPDMLMLAEGDQTDLQNSAFDLDYDWPLLGGIYAVLAKGAPATRIQTILEGEHTRYPARALHMQISDDHDEQRATVKYSPRGALAASALMLTLDGVPLLYNGMEVGDLGAKPIVWEGARQAETFRFYQQMLALRRAHPALRQGETQWITNTDPAHLLTYVRKSGGEEFLVAINLSNKPVTATVDGPGKAQGWRDVTPAGQTSGSPERFKAKPPALSLEAYGFRLFQRKNDEQEGRVIEITR